MALKVALTRETSGLGLALPDAYVRLRAVHGRNDRRFGFRLAAEVEIFADAAARESGRPLSVEQIDLTKAVPDKRMLGTAEVYAALKGLERFAGAVDC